MYVISTIVAIKRKYILKECFTTFYVLNFDIIYKTDSVERYDKDGKEPEAVRWSGAAVKFTA